MDGRFELAEMCTARGEIDPAIPVLAGALKGELPPEFADRIRLRLGACYLAKGDGKAAAAVFAAILKAPKSPVMAPARYGAGEAAFLQKDYAQAVQFLLPFQDGDLYRHLPGTSDRALLRLGYAYAALNQAEPARRAFENLISRFPRSAFANEARYRMGLALQSLKQYDNAITAYTELVSRTGSEFAARAQLGIGLCRMEQKRPQDAANAFMTAFYSYDYPDCSATALLEAARAYIELKLPREATRLLERVIKDFPNTPSAALAQKRLAEIK
jgi:TolA-binding protein